MRAMSDPHWWTAGFLLIVQFVVFLRWLHRRLRNDEIVRVFVHDMATNHLPHIYESLQRLCDQQGIERTKAPVVRWIDLSEPRD